MAPSVMAYLQKIQDGVIFSEGFENQNWLAAEGWTAVQGTPVISNGVSEKGLFSFKCTGDSTGPIVPSIITKTFSESGAYLSIWFWDDATQTTQPGPYLKVKFANGNYFSVGVRNSVSTTNYSYASPGSSVDIPTTASTFPTRTTGWHQIIIDVNGTVPGETVVRLDDSSSNNVVWFGSVTSLITDIFIQSASVADGNVKTFGYFDEVQFFVNAVLTITGFQNNQRINIYDSSNVFEGQSTGVTSTFGFPLNGGFENYPLSMFMEVSKQIDNFKIEFRSSLLQVNPGDIYVYQPINFQRKCTNWSPKEDLLTNQNISASGITETLMNGFKPKHILTVNQLQGQDMKIAINNFFNYCKQGFPFSMMIDTAFPGFGVLAAAPTIGGNAVTVMRTLSIHPNDNFTVGRWYRIFDRTGQMRQKVTLASKTSITQLNFNEIISQPFAQGNYICDDTFLPLLELGANPDGFNMKDPRYIFFDWVQSCQEFTGA